MTAFPLFIELENKPCLVLGGGRVALRKVKTLLKYGADVTVWAKEFLEDFKELEAVGSVKCVERTLEVCDIKEHFDKTFLVENSMGEVDIISRIGNALPTCDEVLNKFAMVICATSDAALNHAICEMAKRQHIWVNSATDKADSNFIFPAVVVRGNVSVGVSSSSETPSLTKYVRTEIDALLPEWYADFENHLKELRQMARQKLPTQAMRRDFMAAVTAYGAAHQGEISDAVVQEILADVNGVT